MTIGHSVQRGDAVSKVTGRARFADDFSMPGMRHAVYVRAAVAHAKVLRVETGAARALAGVEAVFTAADVPQIKFSTAGHPYSLDPTHADIADRNLLTDHVRCFGDEVAVVVARDELIARRAAALVTVEYEMLPVVTSAADALMADASVLHPDNAYGNLLGSHTLRLNGDVEAGLASGDVVAHAKIHTPIVQHCHMENHTAYAYMEDDERVVIVSSTQIPHICRRIVGQALGIAWSRVRVIKPCVGGGFGNKQDVVLEPMVAFLAMSLGVPVRLALEREECMLATRVRHSFDIDCRVGLTRDGRLTGIAMDVLSNTGAYASHGHSIASAGGSKMCAMYPHAPYQYAARTVYSNIPAGGAMRGYGSPQVCFALETVLDDAARALGIDPLDVRLKNVGHAGDIMPLNGKIMHTHELESCLRQGAERFGWTERRKACSAGRDAVLIRARKRANGQGDEPSESLIVRGVGVASLSYGTGTYPINVEPAGARMVLNQDGSVQLSCGATEIGQGADTVFAQMAAETLGLDVDMVRVISAQDTDFSPYDPGAFASRQTFVNGHAVLACAEQLKVKILEHAANMTGRSVEELRLAGHFVTDREGKHAVALEDVALDSFYHKDRGQRITAESAIKVHASPPAFGCTFVEVEVDIALCRVRVTRILNMHDAGVIINPRLAEGQVRGGMSMGMGMALQEELLVDAKTGRVWNANLLDYKLPCMADFLDMECGFVEVAEPTSAYGTKALGEPPVISPAPAIRNAVLDATGVAMHEIPLTPKLLFRHFRAAGLV